MLKKVKMHETLFVYITSKNTIKYILKDDNPLMIKKCKARCKLGGRMQGLHKIERSNAT